MWKTVQCSVMPDELDTTSSNYVVYIRRNIREITKDDETLWECEEKQILKKDWELYSKILTHDTELSEMRDGLIELASIIAEV